MLRRAESLAGRSKRQNVLGLSMEMSWYHGLAGGAWPRENFSRRHADADGGAGGWFWW